MFSLLLPPVCVGCRRLLRSDGDPFVCTLCAPDHHPLDPDELRRDGVEALFAYEGPLARAVTRLKLSGDAAVAGSLGRMLARAPIWNEDWDLVVPVPLHFSRALRRGFNQARLLAHWTLRSAPTEAALAGRVLRRIRPTPSQTELSAARRRTNVLGAFRVRKPDRVADRRVLVLDDVTTTGATLGACMTALRGAGARRVGGLALLRALA
jgi:ComF family protein